MSEPILQVIPGYPTHCRFDKDGMCPAHGTHISDHSSINTVETMTREEAKKRFPEWAERIDALP